MFRPSTDHVMSDGSTMNARGAGDDTEAIGRGTSEPYTDDITNFGGRSATSIR